MPIVVRYKRRVPPGKVAPTEFIRIHPASTLLGVTSAIDDAVFGDGIVTLYTNEDEVKQLNVKELAAIVAVIEG